MSNFITEWGSKAIQKVENAGSAVAETAHDAKEYLKDKATKAFGGNEKPAPVQVAAPPPEKPKPKVVEEKDPKPDYVNLPTVDHNRKICDGQLGQQPLREPGGKWNGSEILNAQTQLNTEESPKQKDQQVRCGPSSVLGSAVMAGPEATNRLVDRLGQKVTDPAQKQELTEIHGRIADGTASHTDLSRVQELMYKKYGSKPGEGLAAGELQTMQSELADHATVPAKNTISNADGTIQVVPGDGRTAETPNFTKSRLDALKPGQSFIQNVDPEGNHNDVHHYVVTGKDADGRSYIYDPYPKANQPQVVYQDERPKAFNYYTGGDMGADIPVNSGGTKRLNFTAGGVVSYDK